MYFSLLHNVLFRYQRRKGNIYGLTGKEQKSIHKKIWITFK